MPAPVALLIEDSKEYALIGAKLLQREGFEVVVARCSRSSPATPTH